MDNNFVLLVIDLAHASMEDIPCYDAYNRTKTRRKDSAKV